jgi:hypothetical protein
MSQFRIITHNVYKIESNFTESTYQSVIDGTIKGNYGIAA